MISAEANLKTTLKVKICAIQL